MGKPYSILLLGVLLGFVAVFVMPTEDIAETAYDESEVQSLVSTSTSPLVAAGPGAAASVVRTGGSSRPIGSRRGITTQRLGQRIRPFSPISDSLTILGHSFRC